MPDNSAYTEFMDKLVAISERFGTEPHAAKLFARWLKDAGFINVREHVFRLPCGPWAKEARLKKVGAFELMNMSEGAQAALLRGWDWKKWGGLRELEGLVGRVRKEMLGGKVHAYSK